MVLLARLSKGCIAMVAKSPVILDHENLPTPKQEEWKYTNLSRALGELQKQSPKGQEPVLIHKKRGEVCGQVEEVVWTGCENNHHNFKLKIVLEEGAELTLIERHEGQGSYWKNMTSEFVLDRDSTLNHIRICDDSNEGVLTNMCHVYMHADSTINSFSLNTGGKLTRHDIHAVLSASGIECNLNGVTLLKGVQHCDTTILMEHTASNSYSNQFFRTILDDEAHGVFQGKVHVHQAAQKTDGYQLSNAILLSPKAEMSTKPELEIYADDVKCSHGATTGQLDEEPLFYLRSRGLSDSEARMLLVQAFVDEVIDNISNEEICTQIKERAESWLLEALK